MFCRIPLGMLDEGMKRIYEASDDAPVVLKSYFLRSPFFSSVRV